MVLTDEELLQVQKALAEMGPVACRWSLDSSILEVSPEVPKSKNPKTNKKSGCGTSKPGRPVKAKVEKPAKGVGGHAQRRHLPIVPALQWKFGIPAL